MSYTLQFIDNVNKWLGRAVSFLIVVLTTVVTYEVAARYIFKHPTIWAHETSSMLFGAYIVLGGAYTLRVGGHVNMDVVYGHLSRKTKDIFDVVTLCITLLLCGVLVWRGGETAWRALRMLEHSGSIWNPPVYPIRLVLPLGAFLLFLQAVVKFLREVVYRER